MAKYDPSTDPLFQPKPLHLDAYDYDDEISEQQINDMRSRAAQKAAFIAKEKARKARLAKQGSAGSLDDEDGENKNQNAADINKKDVTTDHNGKIIQMKTLNGSKLPSMMPSSTRAAVLPKKDILIKESSKQMQ